MSDAWAILSDVEQSIKAKVESTGVPLKEWAVDIFRGVLTGCNDAFIITSEKRNEILANCIDDAERERTAALIRPILRGRDIKRYGYDWANLWLINTHNGVRGRIPRINIEDYPAVKVHLNQYWNKICDRDDQGDTPYNLRNCVYLEDFFKPKIVWTELSDESKFAVCNDLIPLNTVFFLTGEHLNHLLGLLNSKLIHWYFTTCIGTSSGVGTNRWLKYTIEQLPLVQYTNEELSQLVSSCLSNNKMDMIVCESKIDNLICRMYGLTEEESGFILGNY